MSLNYNFAADLLSKFRIHLVWCIEFPKEIVLSNQ
jgi:hypothetical protein